MGRAFGVIPADFWYTGMGAKLRSKPAALTVMMFLLTADVGTTVGIFRTTQGHIADQTGLSRQQVSAAIKQCETVQCLKYDAASALYYIPEQAGIAYGATIPENDNRVKGIKNLLEPFASHPFAGEFLERYGVAYHLTSTTPSASSTKTSPPPSCQAVPTQTSTRSQRSETLRNHDRVNFEHGDGDFAPDCAGFDEAPSEGLGYNKNLNSERSGKIESSSDASQIRTPSQPPVSGGNERKTTTTENRPLERPGDVVVVVPSISSQKPPTIDLRSVTGEEKVAIGELWLLWQKTFERPDAEFDRIRTMWLVKAVRDFGFETSRLMIIGTVQNKFLMGGNNKGEQLVEPRHIFGCGAEHREQMLKAGKALDGECTRIAEEQRIKNDPALLAAAQEQAVWLKDLKKASIKIGSEFPLPPPSMTYEAAKANQTIMSAIRNAVLYDPNVAGFAKLDKKVHESWLKALFDRRDGVSPLAATG